MLGSYVIRAKIDATYDMPEMFAQDWFECGVNDGSERYPSADAALIAAQSAYKGPNADGIACRVWAQQTAEGQAAVEPADSEDRGSHSPLGWAHYGRYQFKDIHR